jgi:hypothetical protein
MRDFNDLQFFTAERHPLRGVKGAPHFVSLHVRKLTFSPVAIIRDCSHLGSWKPQRGSRSSGLGPISVKGIGGSARELVRKFAQARPHDMVIVDPPVLTPISVIGYLR